ncbi:hypothetical protein [Evansella clarkii]|uniref:hypothetical protein n=1 Tax=Evansella clarkii TaxID=79879 RepID=UPI0009975A89|nr:hypothetical protein [Evansella clarkii]
MNLFNHDKAHKMRVRDIAGYMITYPDVKKTSKNLLGLTFNTYQVNLDSYSMKLETKGANDDYILELHLLQNGSEVFSYKAYEDGQSEKDKYPLPEETYMHLTHDLQP